MSTLNDSHTGDDDDVSDVSNFQGITELSPRQPLTKRSSSAVAASNNPISPSKRVKAAINFITFMVVEESTKKPPFKVEAVRTLLTKVSELQ